MPFSFPIDDLHVGCSDLKCWIRWLQVDKRTQKLNKQGSEAKEKILAKYQKKTSTRTSPKGDLFCWKIGAGNASKNLGNLPGDWDEMMEHWLNDNDVTTRHYWKWWWNMLNVRICKGSYLKMMQPVSTICSGWWTLIKVGIKVFYSGDVAVTGLGAKNAICFIHFATVRSGLMSHTPKSTSTWSLRLTWSNIVHGGVFKGYLFHIVAPPNIYKS